MTPNIDPHPDFSRFLDTLLLRQAHRRPPLFDFHVDPAHKARLLGRPVESAQDEVEFWRSAGYDYVQCTVFVPAEELDQAIAASQGSASSHGSSFRLITDLDQFRSKRWSWQKAAEGDLSAIQPRLEWLKELVAVLPPNMKIVLHGADVFTLAWEMMGFDEFCLASLEEPRLVRELMESLAAAQLSAINAAIDIAGNSIGAVFYSDDIAYTEGLLLSPAFYREFLFPIIRRFADAGQRIGAPLIYHSDGRLYDVLDDLHAAGVRGLQPLEPKSMEPLLIKQRWPGKFCLIGNIDLDLMSRGTSEEVEREVRAKIETLNAGGGYMVGVSNTVPHYVNFENYIRMIETAYAADRQ